MLSILGMGSAYPSEEYLQPSGASSQGAGARGCAPRTVLPRSYLAETGNRDFLQAPKAASESPTDLGLRAAQVALQRAGIVPEQLGMIIGDCATPREKTPSEAQRLGKRFGLKVPAFDLSSGSTALVQQLNTLNNWRPDKVPEYVLLVSTNCPTENLNVDRMQGAWPRFCDAAAAVVVSTRHAGRVGVQASSVGADPQACEVLVIDTFGGLALDPAAADEFFASYIDRALTEVTQQSLGRQGDFRLLCTLASKSALDGIASCFQVQAEDRWYEQILEQGDSLGSSVGRVLADRWDELGDGRNIVVAVCGSGMNYGYVVLG